MKQFKKLKSVPKSYEEQGYIYFTCQGYRRAPPYMRQKIDRLCLAAGGEYAKALIFKIESVNTLFINSCLTIIFHSAIIPFVDQ